MLHHLHYRAGNQDVPDVGYVPRWEVRGDEGGKGEQGRRVSIKRGFGVLEGSWIVRFYSCWEKPRCPGYLARHAISTDFLVGEGNALQLGSYLKLDRSLL